LVKSMDPQLGPVARLEITTTQVAPLRAESPRRGHRFFEIETFGAYLKVYGCAGTVLFANPASGVIEAVLDDTAKGGFEVCTFTPMPHPSWLPWEALLSKGVLPLAGFADFVQDNRRAIIEPLGRELAMMLSQVKACEKVEIYLGRGRDTMNGMIVTSKIQGQSKDEAIDLPEMLTISLPLFVKSNPIDIEVDIMLAVVNGGVVVRVSSSDVLDAKVAMFARFFDTLKPIADETHMTLTMGQAQHNAWQYVFTKDTF
jgi:energy-converting hydrogenase Eha subunit C